MSEKNKKISKRVFWTRVLCLVLALIMIGSVCYLAVELIIDAVREKKALEKNDHASLAQICFFESFEYTNGETL